MNKVFVYEIIDKYGYFDNEDDFEASYKNVYYEVDEEDIKDVLVDMLFETYFTEDEQMSFNTLQISTIKDMIRNFTNDNGNWEQLYNDFEDELKDYFEEEALESLE